MDRPRSNRIYCPDSGTVIVTILLLLSQKLCYTLGFVPFTTSSFFALLVDRNQILVIFPDFGPEMGMIKRQPNI